MTESKYAGLSKKERRAVIQKALHAHGHEKVLNESFQRSHSMCFRELYSRRDLALALGDLQQANMFQMMIDHKLKQN